MKKSQAIERLRQVIRRQHKALATEDSYVFWVGRYINSLVGVAPDLPSEKKLELFLTGLALRENVAASTQNQAFQRGAVLLQGRARPASRERRRVTR